MKFALPVKYGKRTCNFRNKHEKINIKLPLDYVLNILLVKIFSFLEKRF